LKNVLRYYEEKKRSNTLTKKYINRLNDQSFHVDCNNDKDIPGLIELQIKREKEFTLSRLYTKSELKKIADTINKYLRNEQHSQQT